MTAKTFTLLSVGLCLGLPLGAIADHFDNARNASKSTAASPSTTSSTIPSDERVDWCYVESWRSGIEDEDGPLGPGKLMWALRGHHPHDRWSLDAKTVDTGVTRDDMVDRAKVLGCPLHDEPPEALR